MPEPALPHEEALGLWRYLQLFLRAGEAARELNTVGMRPRERWEPYRPVQAAKQLSPAAAALLRRGPDGSVIDVLRNSIAPAQHLEPTLLVGAVTAGAFWLTRPTNKLFTDEEALHGLEAFTELVNGFLRSLPERRLPDERSTAQEDRLLAYQRRRFGYGSEVRSPRALAERLPEAAHEFIESWFEILAHDKRQHAHDRVAALAVALGRPVDDTIVWQLEIALATALVWPKLHALPNNASSHPLLGDRSAADVDRWDAAADVITAALRSLQNPTPSASPPHFVDRSALVPVADVRLDASSLRALERLDDYVTLFAAWLRVGRGTEQPVETRLAAFDQSLGRPSATSGGHRLIEDLPPHAVAVVGAFAAELEQGGNGHEIAGDLAEALGDEALIGRYWRTLHTATAWLNNEYSVLELTGAPVEEEVELDDIEYFVAATARECEALLDFGAGVVELVRFGRSLDGSDIPPGWWERFHSDQLSAIPGSATMLNRLPEAVIDLMQRYRHRLASPQADDSQQLIHALAANLAHEVEHYGNLTLMVALATGAAWLEAQALPDEPADDNVFGVSPEAVTPLLSTRVRAQLRHCLAELIDVRSIRGI